MTTDEMQTRFSHTLQTAADSVWERFRETMPERYFQETDLETQLTHLHVLTACQASGIEQELMMRSRDGDTWTFLTGRSYPGQLGQMLDRLPKDRNLTAARAYTSKDGQWVLDIFELGEKSARNLEESEFVALEKNLANGLQATSLTDFSSHLRSCAPEYLKAVPRAVCQIHFELVQQVRASGNLLVCWESISEELYTVRITVEGMEARTYFQRLAQYLGQQGIDIERAYVTSFERENTPYRYLGFTVSGAKEQDQARLSEDLKRLYFVDKNALKLWSEIEGWTLVDCEIVDFLVSLAHSLLCQKMRSNMPDRDS